MKVGCHNFYFTADVGVITNILHSSVYSVKPLHSSPGRGLIG